VNTPAGVTRSLRASIERQCRIALWPNDSAGRERMEHRQVTKDRRGRQIAVAAAYGGGGLGIIASAFTGLLLVEAKLARRTVGEPTAEPPKADGVYGRGRTKPIELVLIGDSSAAGLGVDNPDETPGALIAAGLSSVANRRVRLTVVARSGAQSGDLDRQIDLTLDHLARPDLSVVMVGTNDVTHRVRPSVSVHKLEQAVLRLRGVGCEVVVGTCPDLGTVEPIAQPLRYIVRRWSRQLAAAQTIAVVEAGGRSVSLGDILGPEFSARPAELFGPDRFHPSATGYASAAMAILPAACAALGYWPPDEAEPDYRRGEGVLPVALAAAEAVEEAGTEVAGAEVAGRERGPRGRWALLRRRPGPPMPDVEESRAQSKAQERSGSGAVVPMPATPRDDGSADHPNGEASHSASAG
jgi:lysophospholipase L1-like esterase